MRARHVVIVLGLMVCARTVTAHCPNQCDLTEPSLVVDPPLACAHASVAAEECDCGLKLSVSTAGCDYGIVCAPPLDSCKNAPQGPCDGLAADDWGSLHVALSSLGETQRRLTVTDEKGPHRVDVSVTVTSFGGGCSCASAPRARLFGFGPVLFGLALLAASGRRATSARRARRRPDRLG